jgi:hypothetical protein
MTNQSHSVCNLKWVDFSVTVNTGTKKEMIMYLHEGCYDKENQKWDNSVETYTYNAFLKWNKSEKDELKKKERINTITHKKKMKFSEIAMYFLQKNWAYILTGDSSNWNQICQEAAEDNDSQVINFDESVDWNVQRRYSEICHKRYPKTYLKLMRVLNLDINRTYTKGNSYAPYSGLYFNYHNFKLAFFDYLMDHKKFCDTDTECSKDRAVYSLMRSPDPGRQKVGMDMSRIMQLLKKMEM